MRCLCVRKTAAVVWLGIWACVLSGCGKKSERAPGPGTIVFTANGEDFVRKGFVDRTGWAISFDTLLVTIVDPCAYLPPDEKLLAVLEGEHRVDLAEGDADAGPVVVGRLDSVPVGNYQALRFKIRRASSGPWSGHSMVMIGTARKEDRVVPFSITLDEEMDFDGTEGFVGDEVRGLLKPGGTTTVEMTFHFDHIFGDHEVPPDDHINTGSVGFDFFHAFASDGRVAVEQKDMQSADDYPTLVKAVWTLGHLGEGHCAVSNRTSAARIGEQPHEE